MGSRGSKADEAGKPIEYDPNFNGPTKNRGCTDVLCCILLFFFFLAFVAVGIYAFAMGDPRLLIYPMDSDNHLCGSGENWNKPNLLIFDLTKCLSVTGVNVLKMCQGSTQVCVESCPQEFWSYTTSDINKAICKNEVQKATIKDRNMLTEKVNNGQCAPFYMPTSPIVYRCLPKIPGFDNNVVQDENKTDFKISKNQTLRASTFNESVGVMKSLIELQGYGTKILADVTATWWIILLFILLAMVLAFLWIVLMRWIAGVMVWISILLFIGFFVFAIYYCFHKYTELKNEDPNRPFRFTSDFQYYTTLKETWLAIGIIASIVLAIVLIILLFLIKRIRIAIELIKETSRAISSMMFVLLWPLIPFVLQVVVLVFWGSSAICLAAVSRTESCLVPYNDSTWVTEMQSTRCKMRGLLQQIPCDTQNQTASAFCKNLKEGIKDDRYTLALQAFQLFMWFWLMNFIIALGQVTLAGCFASYYWAFNKPHDIPTFAVAGSFYRAVRYHLGSMAFGSLLIAIVKIIIVLLEYLDHKLKGSVNIVARIILKCCICFFWCLEKFLKFLNKNAYIMMAIHGKNFCSSAAKAFSLILRNALRVIVVDKVTDVLLFVNKLFIVGAVGVFAFFTFSRKIPGSEKMVPDQLNYYFIPILIVICGSYIVAAVFFSVYDMGVDTLFLCFLEDLERNDGSPEKPYYMSKSLMGILGKSNKQPPAYNKVNNV